MIPLGLARRSRLKRRIGSAEASSSSRSLDGTSPTEGTEARAPRSSGLLVDHRDTECGYRVLLPMVFRGFGPSPKQGRAAQVTVTVYVGLGWEVR